MAKLFTSDVLSVLSTLWIYTTSWSLLLVQPIFYSRALGCSAEGIGYLTAANGLAAAIATPLAARFIDGWGYTRVLRLGAVLQVLSSLGFSAVEEMGLGAFLCSCGYGLSFVLAFNAGHALVAGAAGPKSLTRALAIAGGGVTLTNAAGATIADFFFDRGSWDAVFYASAAIAALSLVSSLRIHAATASGGAGAGQIVSAPSRHLEVRLLCFSIALVGLVFSAIFIFHQPFALSRGDTSVREFFWGFTGTAVAVRLAGGGILDRVGCVNIGMWACGAYSLAALTLWHAQGPYLLMAGAVFGLAHGLAYPALSAALVSITPIERRGSTLTWFNGLFNLGVSGGGLLWGAVAGWQGFGVVFCLAAGCCAPTFAALFLVAGRQREEAAWQQQLQTDA